MDSKKEKLAEKLKTDYLKIIKQSLKIQKSKDIRRFLSNALKAEDVAVKLQKLMHGAS